MVSPLKVFVSALALLPQLNVSANASDTRPPLRDRLVVVAANSSAAMTTLLSRSVAETNVGRPAPRIEMVGSTRALERFCVGVGPHSPDIALVTRRMPRAMADLCAANGVSQVVEQQLGLGAVVIAVRRGDPTPRLTSQQVWSALAGERPSREEFVPNRVRSWSELSDGLPDLPIRVIVPDEESGTRPLFDELIMENGCRHVRQISSIFSASYRHSKCVVLRRDDAVVVTPSAAVPSALLSAAPGTMAIMSYDQVVASGGLFLALTLDGVQPTPTTIASLEYEQSQALYIYGKRQHESGRRGPIVALGIRQFMMEAASEQASGPGGYLSIAGLVPQAPLVRQAQRHVAARQSLMSQ